MAHDKEHADGGADKTGIIRDLFEHPYFQLAIEKEVRARTNAYLKVVVSVLTVALGIVASIGGFRISSIVDDAQSKYDKATNELKDRSKELKDRSDKIQAEMDSVGQSVNNQEKEVIETLRKSGDAEIRAGNLVNTMGQDVTQAEKANRDAQKVLEIAENAQRKAEGAVEKSEGAIQAANTAKETTEAVLAKASDAADKAEKSGVALDPLINTSTELLLASEASRVMIQGNRNNKNPCTRLTNRVRWNQDQNKFDSYDTALEAGKIASNRRAIRFGSSVRFHGQPLLLHIKVFQDCPDIKDHPHDNPALFEYSYTIKDKFNYETTHPIPGTPFNFRLVDVFYPPLGGIFSNVELSPARDLLKCQAEDPEISERTCPALMDRMRRPEKSQEE